MKASLDTNVIIHLYRAEQESMIFSRFDEGLYIYEQIRNVELENHGKNILHRVDRDIINGQIHVITDNYLREKGVLSIFREHVEENRQLYTPKDLGEVYAISLAQTLGMYSLVTDDIKQGGPYMSLLHFIDNDVMPFSFVDILLLNYIAGDINEKETVNIFLQINQTSNLQWDLKVHLRRFIQRFWKEPFHNNEKNWMRNFCKYYNSNAKKKLADLYHCLQRYNRKIA